MDMACGFEEELNNGIPFYSYKTNGLEYLIHGKSADFTAIDFKNFSDNYIYYKNTKISYQTTLNKLKQSFPKAYKNAIKKITANKGNGVPLLKFNKNWDDELRLLIKNGKVIGFSYWYYC